MTLDLAVLGCLLLLAIFGAITGALRQLLNLASAVAGWLVARALGPSVASGLARSIPKAVAEPVAAVLLFVGTFAAVGILGRLLLRAGARPGGPVRSSADRGLGALLGASQAGLGIWVILSALVLFGGKVGCIDPHGSDFAALAREHNLLRRLDAPAVRALERLLRAARDPGAAAQMRADDETRKLLDDPRIQSILSGASGAAGERGRLSPEALRVLDDPALSGQLERILGKVPEIADR